MNAMRLGAAAAVLVMWAAVSPAGAQAPVHDWSDGTSVHLFGGVAADGEGNGGLLGGGAGWMVSPIFSLEGQVGWSDGPGGAETFAASLVSRWSPRRPRPAVPFVKGGVGLYRAAFDDAAAAMPDFYRRRLSASDIGNARSITWTDPTLVFGGGIDIFASRHIAIRPEVDVTLVLDDGRTHPVTSVTLRLAYHFEARRVTP